MTLFIHQHTSPNCSPRRDGKVATHLILHYTKVDEETSIALLSGEINQPDGTEVSVHYLIHENGHITQFVHEYLRAWHAGVSYWRGETDLNSASIGIELVNPGVDKDYPPFAAPQIQSLILLCQDILKRHPAIIPSRVLGHSDITSGRKLDPGPSFPWRELAGAGIGIMPPEHLDNTNPMQEAEIDAALTAIGYNPNVPVDVRFQAFCTHYATEGLLVGDDNRASALAKLRWVLNATV